MISGLAHFVPPVVVWLAGAYLLYRATQVTGSLSERSFGIGLLLILCASWILSARRSRQTTTREQALEKQNQVLAQRSRSLEKRLDEQEKQNQALSQRLRVVEQRLAEFITDRQSEDAAQVLGEAVNLYSVQKPPWMRLVPKETFGKR